MKKNVKKLVSIMLAAVCIGTTSLLTNQNVNAETQQGSLTLDTRSYSMSPNNVYDFKATVSGTGLKQSDVKVSDSRNGSVVKLTRLANGNFRITGLSSGTTYVVATFGSVHASIKVTVGKGVKPHGEACRAVSIINIDTSSSNSSSLTSDVNTVYKINEPYYFKDANGNNLYSVTITGITQTDLRNKYDSKNPAQLFCIDFTYKNIAQSDNLFLSESNFTIVDAQGYAGYECAWTIDMMQSGIKSKLPKSIPSGVACDAQLLLGVDHKSDTVTLKFRDNSFNNYDATFSINVN